MTFCRVRSLPTMKTWPTRAGGRSTTSYWTVQTPGVLLSNSGMAWARTSRPVGAEVVLDVVDVLVDVGLVVELARLDDARPAPAVRPGPRRRR